MIKEVSGLLEGTRVQGEAILGGGHAEAVRWGRALKVSDICLGKWTEKHHLKGPQF